MSYRTIWAPALLVLGLALLLTLWLLIPALSSFGVGVRRDGAASEAAWTEEAAAEPKVEDLLSPCGDKSLPHNVAIRGRVVDRQGDPVTDATVVATVQGFGDYPYAPTRESARVRSEADGSFVLGPLDLRSYDVWAVRKGVGAGISYNQSPGAFVEVVLSPAASVSGRVTERATGEPLAGALVLLRMSGYGGQTTTDAEGRYSFLLLPVSAREYGGALWVLAEGFASAERSPLILRHGWEERVDFGLVPGRALRGRVVAARTGKPIPGAVVEDSYGRTAVTGAEGAYVLHDVDISPNRTFTVRAGGFLAQTHRGNGTPRLDFSLHASAELVGSIRGPSSEPLSGASVGLAWLPLPTGVDFDWKQVRTETRSDSSGSFRFRDIPPGVYRIVAHHPDYGFGEADPVEIPEVGPSPPPVVVTVRDGMTVEGFVRDRWSHPLPGVRIEAEFGSKWVGPFVLSDLCFDYTGADGGFRLSAVPSGRVRIRATTRHNASRSTQVEGAPGDQVTGVLMTFGGLSVGGVVVDAEGEPFQGATVWARDQSGRREGAHTDALGRFSIGGLLDGLYTLSVWAPFGSPEPLQDVPAGTQDLRVELPPAQELTGTVTSVTDGRPVEHFELGILRATRDDADDEPPQEWRSPNGAFAVRVAPGAYRVLIKAPGHAPRVEEVVVEADSAPPPLRVRLAPGALLCGVVRDRSGQPIPNEEITLTVYRDPGERPEPDDPLFACSDTTDHHGRFFFDGIGPGRYLLSMNLDSRGAVHEQVTVIGSGRVEHDLLLENQSPRED